LQSLFVPAGCVFLTSRPFVSFLFSFLFTVVIALIPFLHFPDSLPSFCF
jgi:hypothetical protein